MINSNKVSTGIFKRIEKDQKNLKEHDRDFKRIKVIPQIIKVFKEGETRS